MKSFFAHSRSPLAFTIIIVGLFVCLFAARPAVYAQAAPTGLTNCMISVGQSGFQSGTGVIQVGKKITLKIIFDGLAKETFTLAQRNAGLAGFVKTRGIEFVLVEGDEQKLIEAGANETLLALIRKAAADLEKTSFGKRYAGDRYRCEGDRFRDLKDDANSQTKYEQAIASYNQAFAIDPADSISLNNLALVYDSLKRYDEAIVSFTRAIELGPAVRRYMNRAAIYEKRGLTKKDMTERRADFDKAVEDYTRAIELEPTYVEAYKLRAKNYEFWGKKELQKADEDMIIKLRNGGSQPVSLDSKP